MKKPEKVRIDAETVCLTCKEFFTMHDVFRHLKEIGTGSHLSSLRCMNCGQKTLDFDFIRVSDDNPVEEIVAYRIRERE